MRPVLSTSIVLFRTDVLALHANTGRRVKLEDEPANGKRSREACSASAETPEQERSNDALERVDQLKHLILSDLGIFLLQPYRLHRCVKQKVGGWE